MNETYADNVDAIMTFIWGTWDYDELEERIKKEFPSMTAPESRIAARVFGELHVADMGYDRSDVEDILFAHLK